MVSSNKQSEVSNLKLKKYARDRGVKLWQIAERFGVSDVMFSKRLRHELSKEDAERFMKYVDDITAIGGEANEENHKK